MNLESANISQSVVEYRNTKVSAGLLMYRIKNGNLEVFLAHPGGPYYKNKDTGYWGIPKGHIEENECCFDAALREFAEETGIAPKGDFIPLGTVRHPSGKLIHAWAFMNDWDDSEPTVSNNFTMEWPPKSGIIQEFPEIDQTQFFSLDMAIQKIKPAQAPFIERLELYIAGQQAIKRNAG